MTKRKRPAPPYYMQPTYPPKFPGENLQRLAQMLKNQHMPLLNAYHS
ncbi:hypothetical protein [Dictyobacter formicarum]|uniref:Uncharacterized protein n=1 Tax=Dictyobacter formicarum TaxID=2778368 RepID=A0ABQ3VCV4_9CHLR|nr:hypothetical protein [Dictyobacter formicarum]GHO83972.1 hypothetical protein KSZ_19780 [Dictyobacter formicarum]